MEKVTTATGDTIDKNLSIKKGDYYYNKLKDVVVVNGIKYMDYSPKIAYDIEELKYNTVYPGKTVFVYNEKYNNGKYIQGQTEHKHILIRDDRTKKYVLPHVTPLVTYDKNIYGISYNDMDHKIIKSGEDKLVPFYINKINNLGPIVEYLFYKNSFTYGVELEMKYRDMYNPKLLSVYNMYPVRDGSLPSKLEMISGIIHNEGTFWQVINFLDRVKNINCSDTEHGSFHLHIGSINFDYNTFLAYYTLLLKLETSLLDLVPRYYTSYVYYAKKNVDKHYCERLPRLNILDNVSKEEKLDTLLSFIFMRNRFPKTESLNDIPDILNSLPKYRINSRYYTYNMHSYFTPKRTIEARFTPMTLEIEEVVFWMVLNTAILKYLFANVNKILNIKEKVSLEDILDSLETEPIRDFVSTFIYKRKQDTLIKNLKHTYY